MSTTSSAREGTQKQKDVRSSNIIAARAVADAIRTSLGPRGMDKMIQGSDGEVSITNDGATILKKMELMHPTAKMLVDLAAAQDVEAGDGTTTVTVLAGSLLKACQNLLDSHIHPTTIVENFQLAAKEALKICKNMATPIDLSDRDSLIAAAATSLSSKVVAQYSNLLAPIAVDAVRHVIDPATATNVDLHDIKVVKKVGGTIDDTELVEGLVLTQTASKVAGGPTRVVDAKIGLIQFQLSPPKSNMENKIVIDNYTMLDRMLKQERKYILDIVKKIKKTGCNVLLIQKSILRDAVSELALNYLAKLKIMVVKEIERDDIEFISKTIGAIPIASIEALSADKLGSAKLIEEVGTSGGRVVKVTGIPTGNFISVFVRGSNMLVLDEAERSLHDALCVIRSIVKQKHMIVGGAAAEIEIAIGLQKLALEQPGLGANVFKAFANAFEIVPYTLAENAGLHPIAIVTELRAKHAEGNKNFGINVRTGAISNMADEKVTQPLLVTTSAISLATATVCMIMKIDDVILVR